eukprot:2370896-Pyramimonas_sp.AAC.1
MVSLAQHMHNMQQILSRPSVRSVARCIGRDKQRCPGSPYLGPLTPTHIALMSPERAQRAQRHAS